MQPSNAPDWAKAVVALLRATRSALVGFLRDEIFVRRSQSYAPISRDLESAQRGAALLTRHHPIMCGVAERIAGTVQRSAQRRNLHTRGDESSAGWCQPTSQQVAGCCWCQHQQQTHMGPPASNGGLPSAEGRRTAVYSLMSLRATTRDRSRISFIAFDRFKKRCLMSTYVISPVL